MERETRKHGGQASPPPPVTKNQKPQQERKVPVVYYLCRNRHLEHPHFIEVPLSSPDGLYLRDVIRRLNALRGKGMPAMYSWSCKRSYKNGFVWHDLCDDDLILPTNGDEYVLKGSELLDQSPPDRAHQTVANGKLQNTKFPKSETPTSSRTNGTSSSSSPTLVFKESKSPSPSSPSVPPPPPPPPPRAPEEMQCLLVSPKTTSQDLANCSACKPSGAADASTQTDDAGPRTHLGQKDTHSRGVSTDGGLLDFDSHSSRSNIAMGYKEVSVSCRDEISPTPATTIASSSGRKMETLETLIKADASKINSFRIIEEEEMLIPTGPRLKATNVLMQLITCGSISVKDHHSFSLVPTYKPRFSQIKYPSTMFASSVMLGELDYLSEKPSLIGLGIEDKEYFSGSLIETKKHMEDVRADFPTLKRSSSYNADRSGKSSDLSREEEKATDSSLSRCLPRPVKNTLNKQPKNQLSHTDLPRNSTADPDCNQSSIGGSKRFTDVSSMKGLSTRQDSVTEEEKAHLRCSGYNPIKSPLRRRLCWALH
ncbi:hypothetical protein HPP92_025961 [Vanilla planifolia]|uniref:SOSEKI DIX-like domain-containing protein n=1 Tax=Vanilla planifolia TaxID=51239 RepID=A0A835PNC2_VANPL|nr:hypothetical protein HPP92_025961 [Vanilla planifolia]